MRPVNVGRVTDKVDPGWWPALPKAVIAIVPLFGGWYLKSVRPLIVGARALVVRTIFYLWLLLAIQVGVAEPGNGRALPWILVGGASISAVGGVVVSRRNLPTRVRPGTEPAILFRSSSAVLVAFVTTPALVGFVGTYLGGGLANYLVGMTVSHGLLLLATPSIPLVDRLQGRLVELGYEVDLHEALLAD